VLLIKLRPSFVFDTTLELHILPPDTRFGCKTRNQAAAKVKMIDLLILGISLLIINWWEPWQCTYLVSTVRLFNVFGYAEDRSFK